MSAKAKRAASMTLAELIVVVFILQLLRGIAYADYTVRQAVRDLYFKEAK